LTPDREDGDQPVDFVSDVASNPFGMKPPCERFVPGYGDTGAHFHVVGDNPRTHGGLDTGIPFTGRPWSPEFVDALAGAGLCERTDPESDHFTVCSLFLSYLHVCDPGEAELTEADYAALEPFFDAELRAITAHVLLPVGARATAHVLDNYTARSSETLDMAAVHATEIRGSGWLVVPIRDPAEWVEGDAERLVETLQRLRESDYEQLSDLGRFMPDDEPYLVR
jgi:uracil-DNA glycosylase